MRDRIGLWTAGLAGIVQIAAANRYDLFRDELYFIVCGQHPEFGYADQPPLVPLLAAGGYALGHAAWSVRLPAIAAAIALPWLMVAFVRLLGGGRAAAWLAGLAGAIAPMFLGLTATLNTTTFEPLAWTAIAYSLTRFMLRDDGRWAIGAGLVAGFALEAKYAIPLWLVALGCGLLATRERSLLTRREVWLGSLLAVAIALPSLVWQTAHGWPFLELVRNAHLKDDPASPIAFAVNQILVFGPLLAPLWIGGIAAPFLLTTLRGLRFISIAYILTAIAIVAGSGKDYYLAPAVPSLFVLGSVAFERVVAAGRARATYGALALASTLALLPLALPLLPPQSVVPYERALHLAPQQQERADGSSAFPSTYADMLGWHVFVGQVGAAYAALTPAERNGTAILVDNYGEAAAIDLYGAPYGLPHARTGHNQYYLWGPGPAAQSRNVLRVQDDVAALRPYCAAIRLLGTTHAAYARPFEQNKAIAYCRGLHPPLARVWPTLKRYI